MVIDPGRDGGGHHGPPGLAMLRRTGLFSLRTILLHLTMRGLPARIAITDQLVVQGTSGQDDLQHSDSTQRRKLHTAPDLDNG